MNPALLDYYRQMQGQGQGGDIPPPAPYNPFDAGISRAIEAARESLGMTGKQQDRAMRNSILKFAEEVSSGPRQKGFFANFAAAGKALGPAINTYDQEEEAALGANNALANQILQYQSKEQARASAEEESAWRRTMAEKQYDENVRQHNLLENFRNRSLEQQLELAQAKADAKGEGGTKGELINTLNAAENLIRESGGEGHRGRIARGLNKVVPGGYRNNESQSAINTMGDILRGKLFNAWGYRNQAEFEHVPSISAENPPEVNLAIIKQLKGMIGIPMQDIAEEEEAINDEGLELPQSVIMQDAQGNRYEIPAIEAEEALRDGLMPVK